VKKYRTLFVFALILSLLSISKAPAANYDSEVSHFVGTGGSGTEDGTSETAKFSNPFDTARDSANNIFILESRALRQLTSNNSVRTVWRLTDNSEWLCSMAIDKSDVFWLVTCSASKVIRVNKSGQILSTINLPQRSQSNHTNVIGIDFLPSGNLLLPVSAGLLIEISPTGTVTTFKDFRNTSCIGGRPIEGNDICPFSVAVSPSGEIVFVGATNSGNKTYRLDGSRNANQLFAVRDPRSVRFTNNAFHIQNYGWEGDCNRTFSRIFRVTGDFSAIEIAAVRAPGWISSGFQVVDSRFLYVPVPPAGHVVRIDLNDGSSSRIGNSDLGCRDGIASASSFFQPSGIAQSNDGSFYLKDDWTIRRITPVGEVTTIYRHSDWMPKGRIFFRNGLLTFIDNQKWVVTLTPGSSTFTRKYLYSVTGDGPQYSAKSMAMDPEGNLFMVLNRNEDWKNKFLRKIDTNGNFTDYTDLVAGNSDAGIDFDANGNLYIASNGQIRRYTNLSARTFNTVGTYFGWLMSFNVSSNGTAYTISESFPTLLLNRYAGNVVDNIIQGTTEGSINRGRTSSFWNTDDLLDLSNGDLLVSDSGNNVVRRISIKGVSTSTPTPTPSASDQPTPTPTPTPFVTPTPLSTQATESKPKPEKPTFKGVNFVGNKVNIEINLGSSASSRPDKVYLVAPKLGINLANPLAGVIAGSAATWSLDFDKLLGGTMLPLEIISERDGVRGDPLTGSYQIPAFIDATRATSVPVAPKNFKSRIIGNSAVITVEATTKSGALATNGYLFSKTLGISKAEAIEGDVVGEKVILEVPIKASMAGKRYPVTIYLTNQKGESKPLNATLSIPAAPKVPSIPTAFPTPKAPKTVICMRANQTRAFEGTNCPPGWVKR
jgi:hypothetical protein